MGALVRRGDKYLVLYRASFPPGLAFVAGHLDLDEEPGQALLRELKEEAGINGENPKLLLHTTIDNPCKRGYASHEWWVYEVLATEEPRLMEPDKHSFVRFMGSDEIRAYADRGDIDPAWKTLLLQLHIL